MMELHNTQMSASEKIAVDNAVNFYNRANVQNGRKSSHELGKDDFLTLLHLVIQFIQFNQEQNLGMQVQLFQEEVSHLIFQQMEALVLIKRVLLLMHQAQVI